MLFGDTYKTVSKSAEGVFRDRGSRFIAFAFPVNSEDEFRSILAKVKADHPKARHHCWALRLTTDRSVFRLNDDGEPSGTAGRPILNILLSMDITNTAVIVVRYFGGTLLGVPGLIHAYKTAAIDALQHADIVENRIRDCYRLEFDYASMNEVMRVVKEGDLVISKQMLDNQCEMDILIPKAQLDHVLERLEKIEKLTLRFLFTA